ncbi:hypothetical protein FQR65_LT14454 [Abscondita terminalis]|nr:hypothetical protein FQR65_LT14454 [Abscondita terminalis]
MEENSPSHSNESHSFKCNSKDFQNEIAEWSIKFNIQHNALSALLVILKKNSNPDFPVDARTLLKTPRHTEIQQIKGGQYAHFGLHEILKYMTNKKSDKIELMVNIDGLPLSKSSNICLWPILCSNRFSKKVYLIGAFFGKEKPGDSNEFLQHFVNELTDLITNGYRDANGKLITICLKPIICDAPAKSFILKVKGHGGYDSCTKCTVKGKYLERRCCFPMDTSEVVLRTDFKFRTNSYEDYQMADTILKQIPNFDLVENVVLDYMHLVCLGVVKKLIILWLDGPLPNRLPSRIVNEINENLISLKSTVPQEFVRKPRAIKEYKLWKATEFRQFLLYSGPVVLRKLLSEHMYTNFLCLHIAITILGSPNFSKHQENINYANSLLLYFVKSFQIIYGEAYVSHNVHNLVHLAEDVKQFGSLDSFSAFQFENHMSQIKKNIRKADRPLQQLIKRHAEQNIKFDKDTDKYDVFVVQVPHSEGPLPELNVPFEQYKILRTGVFSLNCKDPKNNTCILKNGQIVSMSIYSVVEFEDGIQLVPNSWIRGKHAFWPTYTNQIKINKAIAEADEPLSNWPLHKILRILGSAGKILLLSFICTITYNYREGIEKLKMGEAVSDIESDCEKLKKSRHNRAKKVILDDTSDEETDEPTGRHIELPLPPKSINLVTKSTVPISKDNIQGCTSSTYSQHNPTSTINESSIYENAQDNIFEKNVFNEEPTKIPEKDKITNIIIKKLNLINIKLDLLSQSIRNIQHEDITKDDGGFEYEFPLQNLKELEDLEQKLNDIKFFNNLNPEKPSSSRQQEFQDNSIVRRKGVSELQIEENEEYEECEVFVDEHTTSNNGSCWYEKLLVNGQEIKFKLDSGAEST